MLTVTTTGEARLVETLNGIQDQRLSWTVIIFNLNNLLSEYKSDYQLKIAVNVVAELLEEYEGGIYLFSDGAVGVLCNYLNPMLLGKLLFQMRYLYMDDPLAYHEDGQENSEFCTIYRLKEQWAECLAFCTQRMTQLGREAAPKIQARFSPSRLAGIERELTSLDISPALRRQPVCAILPTGAIRQVFDELYINMTHLRELLHAEVDFLSNRWLFQYVTHLLDSRVLALLSEQAGQMAHPVSLNVHVDTLLSEAFTNFDASLRDEQKVSIVFELQAADIFGDMRAFNLARELVQQKGYRVCIDGLTVESFPHILRDKLRVDLLKLRWNADPPPAVDMPENAQLAAAVRSAGDGRVILCRCDDETAVEYGQALGIALFQGRYLDKLLMPHAKVAN